MRTKRQETSLLSIAFLDVITCGFGAILLLLIITKPLPAQIDQSESAADISSLVAEAVAAVSSLRTLREGLQSLASSPSSGESSSASADQGLDEAIKSAEQTLSGLEGINQGLEVAKQSLRRATINPTTAPIERSPEVGGIPVDSEYVIFIIDTSGSMKEIWSRVVDVMVRLLEIHPQVRGFQVMNDNGAYLYESTKRKWLPDTPRTRKRIQDSLNTWVSFSNSSPVEGIERALRTYANKEDKISIYVLGDEFTGSSYEEVLNTVSRLNNSGSDSRPRVRVHGIGFASNYMTGQYATLMRALTEQNRGTLLALPR